MPVSTPVHTNGSGAAAILAAAIGSFSLAVLTVAADKSAAIKNNLVFYKPTGALSGVTTVAILLWLILWIVLELLWKKKTVELKRISIAAFILLALSLLLTFPPIIDIL
jgi:hypothetical protein